jgi:hypothetical protein
MKAPQTLPTPCDLVSSAAFSLSEFTGIQKSDVLCTQP